MLYNQRMTIPLPNQLNRYVVFSDLNPALLNRLAEVGVSRCYTAGGFLTRAGDIWPYLFLVTEGRLNILKESSEGRSLVVAEVVTGELFWGVAFFHEETPNPVTLQINQPTALYLWQRKDLMPILLENGCLSWELSRQMVARMLHASEVIESLAFQPVAGRLARLLLEDFKSAGDAAITRHLTLDEMAARIGTTREMVCRVLYRFADKKLIDVTRTEFVLTDKEGLARVMDNS